MLTLRPQTQHVSVRVCVCFFTPYSYPLMKNWGNPILFFLIKDAYKTLTDWLSNSHASILVKSSSRANSREKVSHLPETDFCITLSNKASPDSLTQTSEFQLRACMWSPGHEREGWTSVTLTRTYSSNGTLSTNFSAGAAQTHGCPPLLFSFSSASRDLLLLSA